MNEHDSDAKFYFLRGRENFFNGDFQNCIRDLIYAQEMYSTMGKIKESAESFFLLGESYYNLKQLSQAKQMFAQALTRFKQVNNLRRIGDCSFSLGEICRNQGDFKLSKQYLLESIEIFKKLNKIEKIADTWRELANTYQISLDVGSSNPMHIINAYKNAIELYKKLKRESKKAETEYDFGHVLISQSKYNEGLKVLTSALDYYKKKNNKENIITLMILIGRIYFEIGKKPKAKEFMYKAIAQMKDSEYSPDKIEHLKNSIIAMFN